MLLWDFSQIETTMKKNVKKQTIPQSPKMKAKHMKRDRESESKVYLLVTTSAVRQYSQP